MSGKNLGIEFLPYVLLANQIAGFLKVLYLKNELYFLHVINKVIGLDLAFLDITQSSSTKLLISNIFKRQIWSSFLCVLSPANRGFYEITVVGPSFIACVDQFNPFCKSCCLIFFQLFWWSYIILTSKKWQPNFSKVF